MAPVVEALGSATLVALLAWYAGGPLLRLAATSCFVCAAGLLALGDVTSAGGVTGCGLASWIGGHVLYRARRGHWKSPRTAALLGRDGARRHRHAAGG